MKRPQNREPQRIHPQEARFFVQLPDERFKYEQHPRLMELYFKHTPQENPYGYPDGLWAVAGGVSWPIYVEDEGLVGVAHTAGFHLETRTIWFFSERKFIVMAPNENYPIDAPRPLKSWLEANYEQFHITTYYFQEHAAVAGKFINAGYKTFPRRPRPHFVPFPWVEMATAMQTMQEFDALGRLRIPPQTRLNRELLAYDADRNGTFPALFSATVLVNALDRNVNNDYSIGKAIKEFRSF